MYQNHQVCGTDTSCHFVGKNYLLAYRRVKTIYIFKHCNIHTCWSRRHPTKETGWNIIKAIGKSIQETDNKAR